MSRMLVANLTPRHVLIFGVVVLTLVVAGSTLAAGPSTGRGAAIEPAATAQWANCPGFDFYPDSSDRAYGSDGTGRTGYGFMFCGLRLPHGATVTAVKFHLLDAVNIPNTNITCYVSRAKLDPPNDKYQRLAGPISTTGSPGLVTRTDLSIAYATVDNRSFSYWAECYLPVQSRYLEIYGATVRYQV